MPRHVVHYRNSAMSRMLPLVMAAREGRQEEVTALLASGLEVNQQGEYDISALHMASLHNHPGVVRTLLEHGADTGLTDAWGCCALHNAAGRGYLDIVVLLVEAGADINTRCYRDTSFILYLSLCIRSDRAKTPLEIARTKGHFEVIRYLQLALQNRFNPNVHVEQSRQIRKLPELVIEEVAEEEEEGALDDAIQEKKADNDCYLQELEIYLESLNLKRTQVIEQKDREIEEISREISSLEEEIEKLKNEL